MAYTMRYAAELRDPADYFRDVKKVTVDADSLALAKELIKRKSGKFDPSKFVDGYEVALKELVEAKLKHAPVPGRRGQTQARPGHQPHGRAAQERRRLKLGDGDASPKRRTQRKATAEDKTAKGLVAGQDAPSRSRTHPRRLKAQVGLTKLRSDA